MNKENLANISQLQFGYYSKPSKNGNVIYLQAKHFNELGYYNGEVETYLQITEKNESHLLSDGDVVFVGKGQRNFAWTYRKEIGSAIASSIFYVIKPDQSKILPDYLTTVFNMAQTQSYFQTLGAGSSIPSIRKSELEAFSINLPNIETQRKVIEIKQLHIKEMQLSHQINQEKKKIYQTAINRLILPNQ